MRERRQAAEEGAGGYMASGSMGPAKTKGTLTVRASTRRSTTPTSAAAAAAPAAAEDGRARATAAPSPPRAAPAPPTAARSLPASPARPRPASSRSLYSAPGPAAGRGPDAERVAQLSDEMVMLKRMAGGSLMTSTRPTLNRRAESERLYYEQTP